MYRQSPEILNANEYIPTRSRAPLALNNEIRWSHGSVRTQLNCVREMGQGVCNDITLHLLYPYLFTSLETLLCLHARYARNNCAVIVQ